MDLLTPLNSPLSGRPAERNEDYPSRLTLLLEAFASLLCSRGIPVLAHTPQALARYASYPTEIQSRIYEGFARYLASTLGIVRSEISLENTAQSLWCVFKRHQMIPCSDFFSSLGEKDVVELYLANHTQWYRSFNYYRYSSYSLGELICFPWNELIEHQDNHMEEFVRVADGIFSDSIKDSVRPELGATISRERFSTRGLVARLRPKILSPISSVNGRNEALAVVWEIELVGERQKPDSKPLPPDGCILGSLQLAGTQEIEDAPT